MTSTSELSLFHLPSLPSWPIHSLYVYSVSSFQDLLKQSCGCRSVDDSHVKTNFVHTLYQVQKFGVMPIEKFADLLKLGERKRCLQNRVSKKWYSIHVEVFTSFIFRVRGLVLESVGISQIPIEKLKL